MFNVKKPSPEPPQWQPNYSTKHTQALWRELQEYDLKTEFGQYDPNRDRYKSIKPFEFNMWCNKSLGIPYFNGSIYNLTDSLRVIAMQAPLKQTLADFVNLATTEKITHILTLGDWRDGKSDFVKMEPYWETGLQATNADGASLKYIDSSLQEKEGYRIRQLELQASKRCGGGESIKVCHIHFWAWPDHLTPDRHQFEEVLYLIASKVRSGECGPLVVHCSAGVGRTGTFLAALKMNLENSQNVAPAEVVFRTVGFLKSQRFLSVESREQFEFLLQ